MDEKEIKMNSRETFDRQANSYDHDIKGRHARRMYQVVLNTLNNISYSNFLDLGCGTGEGRLSNWPTSWESRDRRCLTWRPAKAR